MFTLTFAIVYSRKLFDVTRYSFLSSGSFYQPKAWPFSWRFSDKRKHKNRRQKRMRRNWINIPKLHRRTLKTIFQLTGVMTKFHQQHWGRKDDFFLRPKLINHVRSWEKCEMDGVLWADKRRKYVKSFIIYFSAFSALVCVRLPRSIISNLHKHSQNDIRVRLVLILWLL